MANIPHLADTMVITLDGSAIVATNSYGFNASRSMIETTTFDSAGNKDFRPGLREFDISFDAAVLRDASLTTDYEALLTTLTTSDASVAIVLDDSDATTDISMVGYLESIELSGSLDDKQTYSGAIKVTGGITIA